MSQYDLVQVDDMSGRRLTFVAPTTHLDWLGPLERSVVHGGIGSLLRGRCRYYNGLSASLRWRAPVLYSNVLAIRDLLQGGSVIPIFRRLALELRAVCPDSVPYYFGLGDVFSDM